MKFDRIVLFVLGNSTGDMQISAQALQNEIKNRISYTCEGGSVYGACFVTYNGAEGDGAIRDAIYAVQADAKLQAFGIAANAINCVFVVNNSLSAEQWKRCFTTTRRAVDSVVQKANYYAIVQRDSMDNRIDMAAALANANMAVYCFQQQTENGHIIYSETDEKQLMAYYALLAGAGELNVERGVYTGSFNKLSLMAEDFSRIRNYYVVRGLMDTSNRDRISEDALLNAFFGSWVNNGAGGFNASASYELLRQNMRNKLMEFFPRPDELAILANKEDAITNDNIKRFIEINFENKQRFANFADGIVSGKKNNAGRPGIVQSWEMAFDNSLDSNPVYYCDEVSVYIHDVLVPWIRRNASQIEKGTNNMMNGMMPNVTGGKDFIGSAIVAAQQSMNRYVDQIAVKILNVIADKMEHKAIQIRDQVKANIELFERKNWTLEDADHEDFKHYASGIIELISSYCRNNNLPYSAMNSASEYFGEGVEANWEALVMNQNLRIQSQFKDAADLISQLQNDDAATFREDVPKLLKDRGYRLNFIGSSVQPAAGTPRTIYIIPTRLGVGINGKDFPEASLNNCKKIEVGGFDNVIQFKVTRLTATDNSAAADSAENRRAILESLTESRRYIRPIHQRTEPFFDGFVAETEAAAPVVMAAVGKGHVKCVGNKLEVKLPSGVSGELRWEIEGYAANGSRRTPEKKTKPMGGALTFEIMLNGFFGHCSIRIYQSKTGEDILYSEFEGPKVSATECKRSRPLFGKTKNVQLLTGEFTAEHHIFKLVRKDDAPLEACINPTGVKNDDAFRYPIGGGKEWDVWVGEAYADSMTIEACDREGIRQLDCIN